MWKPHVFVAMPFRTAVALPASAAQAAVSVDFDLLYQRLIAPAVRRADCEPFRADEETAAGDIRTDMFFELVTADAVLADVSNLNPNVLYELGVRHGVAPRGVFVLHGGWLKRPFDIAPDRTLGYDGRLFQVPVDQSGDWAAKVEVQVEALAQRLKQGLAADGRTVGSPVYAALPGLVPVDWSRLQTARSKYFGGIFDDWRSRIDAARKRGLAGDILTLAEDAPTRFHQGKLLHEAARALIDLRRFEAARRVLQDTVQSDPSNLDAQCQLGLVMGRLGDVAGAETRLRGLAERHQAEPEVQGILGRVYKDRWRMRWVDEPDLVSAQRKAIDQSSLLAEAIRCYALATRRHLDAYYTGINVVGLVALLDHLAVATGRRAAAHGVDDAAALSVVVRIAATQALEVARQKPNSTEAPWAQATLGELALVDGDAQQAQLFYRDAAAEASVTWFQIDSMLQQLQLYRGLGFRPAAVLDCIHILESAAQYVARPRPTGGRFIVFAGHMIDKNRPQPRFPQSQEGPVRAALERVLRRWSVGREDTALCGGARGGDILFAELCQQLGARVQLYLPLAEPEFVEASVRLDAQDSGGWVARFRALRAACDTYVQPDRLGPAPDSGADFVRNNRWIVNTAWAEARPQAICAALVWDGKDKGDGPGGTADFALRVRDIGGQVAVIDPMTAKED